MYKGKLIVIVVEGKMSAMIESGKHLFNVRNAKLTESIGNDFVFKVEGEEAVEIQSIKSMKETVLNDFITKAGESLGVDLDGKTPKEAHKALDKVIDNLGNEPDEDSNKSDFTMKMMKLLTTTKDMRKAVDAVNDYPEFKE